MYSEGEGTPQDYAVALRWYRKAADQGFADAQGNPSIMYFHGEGVPQDFVQMHMWANLAASKATGDAHKDFTSHRNNITAKMTPTQIAEAQRLAWVSKPRTN